MSVLIYLIPVSIALGAIGLVAFLWSLRSGQYQDLDGAAERILFDDDRPVRAGRDAARPAPRGGRNADGPA
ncbi:MAG: cytochrome oxidase maturation protein, cbb3-type [Devosia sp. 67-54]|uniref:cbb3-type cytochrome oxidase assembly protein CcoS n=1 Tax=unclassified Devosia TaxID=196773 RepID=UPI0009684B45|nr:MULTISPECIES: cbb3-type cytochrome oxidase assembly protein CcoS [unclassified Devosia]MBN9305511.1 cbb3-type cytochrome oxidase assembly protein CcoS [Devosia sp.]OJX19095.1 MAG: cytochrome oxidase maturation protein, cbb3-type [Devosia sp. 67-54]